MVRALLAVVVLAAIPVAYSQAHEGVHAVINGPSNLGGIRQDTNHDFVLKGVTIDCPGPEGGQRCKIVSIVKTRKPVRVKDGQRKRIVRLARGAYWLNPNSDGQPVRKIHLSDLGDDVLVRYGGRIPVRVEVHVYHEDDVRRFFKFVLKDHL
jgi:hypothetical protein